MLSNTRIGALVDTLSKVNDALLWQNAINKRSIQTAIEEQVRLRLQKGEMPDGELITNQDTGDSYYAQVTEDEYAKIGRTIRAGEHYTMKHTGEFYNSIRVDEIDDASFIVRGEKKDVDLYEKYGENLTDLSDENISKIISPIKDNYIEQLRWFLDDY